MQHVIYESFQQLSESGHYESLLNFQSHQAQSNFFQAPVFFQFIEEVEGFNPFLILTLNREGAVNGSLLAVIQSDGKGLKSWFSRRMIIWGGPLVDSSGSDAGHTIAADLLEALTDYAAGRAIFIEFRNFFDTAPMRNIFEAKGFTFHPHLNFLVKTDEEKAVRKRMSSNRKRQIKSSIKCGATIAEPESETEVLDFYEILQDLYREKVKKPLPGPDLFLRLWRSDAGKIFLVKHEGAVVGGIACPIFKDKVIYEWYVCGKDWLMKKLHPSVLATWAPIEYGIQNGLDHFDFMGAGKPDQDYGVREFKARFGGEEVQFGRYNMVVNKPLYEVGKLGLKVYQKLM